MRRETPSGSRAGVLVPTERDAHESTDAVSLRIGRETKREAVRLSSNYLIFAACSLVSSLNVVRETIGINVLTASPICCVI
jgi:hypothetical protein